MSSLLDARAQILHLASRRAAIAAASLQDAASTGRQAVRQLFEVVVISQSKNSIKRNIVRLVLIWLAA
jgi:hypothetical protein